MKRIILAQVTPALNVFFKLRLTSSGPYLILRRTGSLRGPRSSRVDMPRGTAFVACLAQNDLPFWRELKEKGSLAKVSVFRDYLCNEVGAGVAGVETSFISSHLAEGANADSFVQALEEEKRLRKCLRRRSPANGDDAVPADLSTWARETFGGRSQGS